MKFLKDVRQRAKEKQAAGKAAEGPAEAPTPAVQEPVFSKPPSIPQKEIPEPAAEPIMQRAGLKPAEDKPAQAPSDVAAPSDTQMPSQDPTETLFSLAVKKILELREGSIPEQPLPPSLRRKLDDFDKARGELERKMLDLRWRSKRGEDVNAEFNELAGKNVDLVASSGYVELVEAGFPPAFGADRRELTLRRRELMLNSIKSFPDIGKLSYIAERTQAGFRAKIGPLTFSENEIEQLLGSCPDPSLRMDAARAKEQSLEALGPIKLALANAHNEVTRELYGRRSYAHLLLEGQDSDIEELGGMIVSFEERTRGAMRALTEAVCKTFGLASLDHRDSAYHFHSYFAAANPGNMPLSPEYAMEKLKLTLAAMGFAGVGGLNPASIDKPPFTFDIGGGPKHSTEECAMRAGPGANDYRIFVNPEVSPSGVEFTRTVLLEAGRALHFHALDRLDTRDAFKWESDCMRHAVAMLFGSVTSEEKWFRDIAKMDDADAKVLATMMRFSNLLMARNLAQNALFELKLYLGESPPDAYREVAELFFGSKLDYEVGKSWAWHPYLAQNPGGQLSYALGYMIYEMLAEDVRDRFGSMLETGVADYMVRRHMTGYELPWPQRLNDILKRGR